MFQSTHPHGVRQSLRPSATLFHVVSIHAPTRGATSHDCYSPFSVSCFNPRTHTGCDFVSKANPTMTCRFNPRTHTGCDLRISRHRPSTVLSFQSTHPHGVRRYVIRRILRRAVVSIHAPTRGATSYIYNRYFAPVVSIHAPTRGATSISHYFSGPFPGFNPRTHTGCDPYHGFQA